MRIFVFGDIEEQLLWSKGIHSTVKAAFHLLRAARLLIKKCQLLRVGGASSASGINVQSWRAPRILCSWQGSPEAWAQGQGRFRNTEVHVTGEALGV